MELTGDANNNIVADAIKLVRARNVEEGPWSYVNNSQAVLTGTWTASTSAAGGWRYGADWLYSAAGSGENSITWPMAVPEAGRYNIIVLCQQSATHTTAARYVVHHDGGTTEVPVNQQVNGYAWVPLGTYSLTPGSNPRVYLDNGQPGVVCADAIAFGRDRNDRRVVADAVKFVPNTAEAALAVHADHLGTPQKMTDNTGAVVWDAAYRPFGEAAAISGAATNNQRFPGQYFDAETGLHYNWMRDYDPALGRYVQSDPVGLRGGVNTYAYVDGNPVSKTDPTGENPVAGAIGGGVVAGPPGAVVGAAVGAIVLGGILVYKYCTKDSSRDDECEKQYERDIFECKMFGKRSCYEQAAKRYAACRRGDPLPPLSH